MTESESDFNVNFVLIYTAIGECHHASPASWSELVPGPLLVIKKQKDVGQPSTLNKASYNNYAYVTSYDDIDLRAGLKQNL